MTSISVPASIAATVADACVKAGLPQPDIVGDPGTSERALVWEPDLTAPQAAIAADIVAIGHQDVSLSLVDWAAIVPRRDALKVFRQQSQADFMAKTAVQRDRELFDATNDLIAIVLRLLRD